MQSVKQFFFLIMAIVVLGCSKEEKTPNAEDIIICKILTENYYSETLSKVIIEHKYNSNNNYVGYFYYENGPLVEEGRNYEHDNFGNVTYQEIFKENKLNTIDIRTFIDIEKPLTWLSDVQSNKYYYYYKEYFYGDENQLERILSYNIDRNSGDSTLIGEENNYQYDHFGNVTYSEVNSGQELYRTLSAEYLEFEKPVYIENYYHKLSRDNNKREEYYYNEEKRLVEYKRFYDGRLSEQRSNYLHNENGNVTYYEKLDNSGQTYLNVTLTYHCYTK